MSDEVLAPLAQKKRSKLSVPVMILLGICLVSLSALAYLGVEYTTRNSPAFCANCHNMKSHVDSYQSGKNMDNIHKQANVGCEDCHSDYSAAAKLASAWKYITGNYETSWSRRKVADEMCLKCHISLKYHATRTDFLHKNPHLSHWPELRCGSCHISHDKQVDYCSRCHDNGGQRMTGAAITPRADNPWASDSSKQPPKP
ncbi:MAG TPA: cytochrome c3 family protein [Anaerolineaceae bacterium]